MTTVREHIVDKLSKAFKEVTRISTYLEVLPEGLGELEADRVYLIGDCWLSIGDSSHPDLGTKLATLTDQTATFVACGSTRTAVFKDVGPFYKVDLDRPNQNCRKVRVLQLAKEKTLEICGELPDGYELLEELDVPA